MLVGMSPQCGTPMRIPMILMSLLTHEEKTLLLNGSVNYSAYLVNDKV